MVFEIQTSTAVYKQCMSLPTEIYSRKLFFIFFTLSIVIHNIQVKSYVIKI